HATTCKKDSADRSFDADSRKYAKTMLASYIETIPVLVARGAKLSAKAKKQLAALGAKAAAPTFDSTALKKTLAKADRDAVGDACEVLADPAAVAHRDWAALVERAIAAS